MARQTFTKACSACGAPFLLNPTQTARLRKDPTAAVYCSRVCSGTTLAQATCAYPPCGKTFHPNYTQRKRIRDGGEAFCSTTCYVNSRITYTCADCGATFYASEYQRRKAAKGLPIRCGACRHGTDKASVAGERVAA